MLVDAKSKPHDIVIYTDGSVTRDWSGWGVHGQAGWKDCTRRQWCPQSRDLQPDHGGRSSHTYNTMVSLPAWRTDHTCHHSHRLNEPPEKRWSLGWTAPTWTQPCTDFGCKDFCESTALSMPESVGKNGQIDWHALIIITFGLQRGRAEELRGLNNFLSMDRPEHHSTDRLKERGVKKGSGHHSTLWV